MWPATDLTWQQAARDAIKTLEALQDVPGAFRVTAISQLRMVLDADEKGNTPNPDDGKATPGPWMPWQLAPDPETYGANAARWIVCAGPDGGEEVSGVFYREADARLAAEAPTILSILGYMAEASKTWPEGRLGGLARDARSVLARLRAAGI